MIEYRWVTFLVTIAIGLKSDDYPPRLFRSRFDAKTPAKRSRLRNCYSIALSCSIGNWYRRFRFDSFVQCHLFHVRGSNVRHKPRDFTNIDFSRLVRTSRSCESKNSIVVRFANQRKRVFQSVYYFIIILAKSENMAKRYYETERSFSRRGPNKVRL